MSDKAKASKQLPILDRIRSYPTTVFIDGSGKVRAIYTGFSGPATGAAHDELKRQFEKIVRDLLGKDAPAQS